MKDIRTSTHPVVASTLMIDNVIFWDRPFKVWDLLGTCRLGSKRQVFEHHIFKEPPVVRPLFFSLPLLGSQLAAGTWVLWCWFQKHYQGCLPPELSIYWIWKQVSLLQSKCTGCKYPTSTQDALNLLVARLLTVSVSFPEGIFRRPNSSLNHS